MICDNVIDNTKNDNNYIKQKMVKILHIRLGNL